MNVEAIGESPFELRDIGDMGENSQFDLRVIGRDKLVARARHEGSANLRPSSLRIGMFCRLGSEEESRPVVVAASA